MKIRKAISTITVSGLLSLASAGIAFGAEGDLSISDTGPDSTNTVSINNDVDIDIDNDNDVNIDNTVDQDATSGDATVSRNTSGGDATSGEAANESDLSTSVTIDNSGAACCDGLPGPGGNGGPSTGGTGGPTGGTGGPTGSATTAGGVGGGSLGGGVGGGSLPGVGAIEPLDVSSLRNFASPVSGTPDSLVKQSKGLSTALLAAAALMSLLGAAGSAVYAGKTQKKA